MSVDFLIQDAGICLWCATDSLRVLNAVMTCI